MIKKLFLLIFFILSFSFFDSIQAFDIDNTFEPKLLLSNQFKVTDSKWTVWYSKIALCYKSTREYADFSIINCAQIDFSKKPYVVYHEFSAWANFKDIQLLENPSNWNFLLSILNDDTNESRRIFEFNWDSSDLYNSILYDTNNSLFCFDKNNECFWPSSNNVFYSCLLDHELTSCNSLKQNSENLFYLQNNNYYNLQESLMDLNWNSIILDMIDKLSNNSNVGTNYFWTYLPKITLKSNPYLVNCIPWNESNKLNCYYNNLNSYNWNSFSGWLSVISTSNNFLKPVLIPIYDGSEVKILAFDNNGDSMRQLSAQSYPLNTNELCAYNSHGYDNSFTSYSSNYCYCLNSTNTIPIGEYCNPTTSQALILNNWDLCLNTLPSYNQNSNSCACSGSPNTRLWKICKANLIKLSNGEICSTDSDSYSYEIDNNCSCSSGWTIYLWNNCSNGNNNNNNNNNNNYNWTETVTKDTNYTCSNPENLTELNTNNVQGWMYVWSTAEEAFTKYIENGGWMRVFDTNGDWNWDSSNQNEQVWFSSDSKFWSWAWDVVVDRNWSNIIIWNWNYYSSNKIIFISLNYNGITDSFFVWRRKQSSDNLYYVWEGWCWNNDWDSQPLNQYLSNVFTEDSLELSKTLWGTIEWDSSKINGTVILLFVNLWITTNLTQTSEIDSFMVKDIENFNSIENTWNFYISPANYSSLEPWNYKIVLFDEGNNNWAIKNVIIVN